MKKLIILLLLGIAKSNAQPDITWQACFGSSNSETAHQMRQVPGGSIIVGATETDYHLVKIDDAGNLLWEKSFGGSGLENAFDIQKTADGGYIFCGQSNSTDGDVTGNHGQFDVWVVKTDAAGNLIWQKSLGGSDMDIAYAIDETADGGYILVGDTASNDGDVTGNHGSADCWVVKLDNSGNTVWQKALGGNDYDGGYSVSRTIDGGYIVGGRTRSNDGDASGNHGFFDCWAIKLDAAGTIEWQKQFGGTANDSLMSIIQIADGSYIAACNTNSSNGDVTSNHGSTDGWIIKLSASGTIQWQKTLGGTSAEHLNCIAVKANGSYLFGGYSPSLDGDVSTNNGGLDLWFGEISPTGDLQWQKSLGGSSNETMASIAETDDGGVLIAATTISDDFDVVGGTGTYDKWIVKLDETLSVGGQESSSVVAYPNPVVDVLTIAGNSDTLFDAVSVFHISGEKILTKKNSNGQLNVESLASGIYYFVAISQNVQFLKKFVKK